MESQKIEASGLWVLMYSAMRKVPFTSMLTTEARRGLAADLSEQILKQVGLDLDGQPLS